METFYNRQEIEQEEAIQLCLYMMGNTGVSIICQDNENYFLGWSNYLPPKVEF